MQQVTTLGSLAILTIRPEDVHDNPDFLCSSFDARLEGNHEEGTSTSISGFFRKGSEGHDFDRPGKEMFVYGMRDRWSGLRNVEN